MPGVHNDFSSTLFIIIIVVVVVVANAVVKIKYFMEGITSKLEINKSSSIFQRILVIVETVH